MFWAISALVSVAEPIICASSPMPDCICSRIFWSSSWLSSSRCWSIVMNFSSSVVSAFELSAMNERYVVSAPVPSDTTPTPVLATVMPVWTCRAVCRVAADIFAASPATFAPVAAASAAALPAAAIPATMLPTLHPSCRTMIEMLMMSEAASMALFLSQPYFSCR